MLPKFRPATLGREALARPSIRPVRPSPPPPPPSPPRKFPSGFGPKGGAAAIEASHYDEPEPPTAVGGVGEPSTMNRGPVTVPQEPNARRGRANAVKVTFDDETQARRVDNDLLDNLRAPVDLGVPYDSLPSLETPRPYDAYEEEFAERDPVTMLHGARESARILSAKNVAYQKTDLAQPAYKEEPPKSFQEPASFKEPSYKEPSYRQPSYADDSYEAHLAPSYPAPQNDLEFFPPRREESGPRERPSPPPPARSYAAPAPSYDDASDSDQWGRDRAEPNGWSPSPPPAAYEPPPPSPVIPPAPRVPNEMRPAFVVGVQPLRGPTPDAWGTPRAVTPGSGALPSPMQAINASMPAPYAQQRAQVQYAPTQAQPQRALPPPANVPFVGAQYAPPPAPYGYPAPQRLPTPMPISQPQMNQSAMNPSAVNLPIGQQLTQPPASAPRIGRFAWFIAGAAFGITFAFFATGFFNAGKAQVAKEEFPAPAPLPTLTAPAPTTPGVAPPNGVAPVTAPAGSTPPAGTLLGSGASSPSSPSSPSSTSGAPVKPPPPPKADAAPPPPPKTAPARPRPQPRRPSVSSAPSVPKNLGGGGPGADDAPSAPAPAAPSSGGGDLGDLLGAGLKP